MRKVKIALATIISLPAVILFTTVFALYSIMVGVFYLVQKPISMAFSSNEPSKINIPIKQQHVKNTAQSAIHG
jgi:hypothetical protein